MTKILHSPSSGSAGYGSCEVRRLKRALEALYKPEDNDFRISQLSQYIECDHRSSSELAQVSYSMPAFNSKWKCEKSAAAIQVVQNTYAKRILCCCFAEDSNEKYKKL